MDANCYALSHRLGFALKARGLKLAAAESCTGGGFSLAITEVSGSSDWFHAGFITYSNISKVEQLGVGAPLIEEYTSVSAVVAGEMASGALKKSEADIAVSFTGLAGPGGGTSTTPVGVVWMGVAEKGKAQVECRKVFFDSGRQHIRDCAVIYALCWLIDVIENK